MIIRVIPMKLGYAQILSKSGLSYIQEHLFTTWMTSGHGKNLVLRTNYTNRFDLRQSKSFSGLQFCFQIEDLEIIKRCQRYISSLQYNMIEFHKL